VRLLREHNDDKVIIFQRGELLFAFNFHWSRSFVDYRFEAPEGAYRMILTSDADIFGGHHRLSTDQRHTSTIDPASGASGLSLYLPNRTAVVLLSASGPG
jgi:1,4-alpha-glucan branching enzyme